MDPSKMTFLQSVLRYSTSHTDGSTSAEAGDSPAALKREMSPERKKWLDQALGSMTINPIDEMKKCIKVLESDNEADNDARKLEALETLKDWCEDMNFAIDFHKLNGYSLLPKLLNSKSGQMRALTCELVGACAQNNPYCQETLVDAKMLPLMLYKLDKDEVDEVKVKAMFAIGCLTRDFEAGQQKLLEGNAFDILTHAIQSPIEKLRLKSCFLFSSICKNKAIKGQLTNKNLMRILVDMYRQPDSTIHEHLLSAISVLIEDNPQALQQAKDMRDINFKQILAQRLEIIGSDPRFSEEKEMATSIYQNLFQN